MGKDSSTSFSMVARSGTMETKVQREIIVETSTMSLANTLRKNLENQLLRERNSDVVVKVSPRYSHATDPTEIMKRESNPRSYERFHRVTPCKPRHN